MADFLATSSPTTLADYESLVADKDASRKVLIHTIRDYMPFFDQGIVMPGNDGFGDKAQIITSYPEGQTRAINEGWSGEAPKGQIARYTAAQIRTRNELDLALYNTQKEEDRAAYRLRKDQAFMQGLARSAVRKVFYGDSLKDPTDVMGLANIVTKKNEAFADRIINAGGTSGAKHASIWLINWNEDGMYMFYPQGGEGPGLQMEDMGEQYAFDANGKRFRAMTTEFAWDLGVAAYDPTKIVRVANIDVSALSKSRTAGADLVDLMAQALEMLPDDSNGKLSFYMNDTLRSVLRRQMMNTSNAFLNWQEIAGRKVMAFGDTPVHKLGSDVLTNTEEAIK